MIGRLLYKHSMKKLKRSLKRRCYFGLLSSVFRFMLVVCVLCLRPSSLWECRQCASVCVLSGILCLCFIFLFAVRILCLLFVFCVLHLVLLYFVFCARREKCACTCYQAVVAAGCLVFVFFNWCFSVCVLCVLFVFCILCGRSAHLRVTRPC